MHSVNNNYRCFISHLGIFFGTFLVPIALVIILNTIVFVIAIRVVIKSRKRTITKGNHVCGTIKLMTGIAGLMVMFGMTWLFGVLTIRGLSTAFQYLFIIFNAFQGVYFFAFICIIGSDGREFWIETFKKAFTKQRHPLHSNGRLSKDRSNDKGTLPTVTTGVCSDSLKPEVFSPSYASDKSYVEFSKPKVKVQQVKSVKNQLPMLDSIDGRCFAMESVSEAMCTFENTIEKDSVTVFGNSVAAVNPIVLVEVGLSNDLGSSFDSEKEHHQHSDSDMSEEMTPL